MKCGNQKGHAQVVSDPNLHVYNPGSVPVSDTGRERLSQWGPMTWIAVAFSALLFGLIAYASMLR